MGYSSHALVARIFVSVILPPGSAPPEGKQSYPVGILDKAAVTYRQGDGIAFS